MLLQIGGVQQLIVRAVTNGISERVNAEVSIGKVEYRFFNTISLHDVYVEDLQQDTLLHIGKLNAKFNFFRLFRGQIIIYSAAFNELYGNLTINEVGENNFNFLIEAFSRPPSDKPKPPSELEFNIRQLKVVNSEIRFNNFKNQKHDFQDENSDEKMNFNRLHFKNINAVFAFDMFRQDSLNFRIKSFDAEEKSGFQLTNLQTAITASNTKISMPDFSVILPNSYLKISDVTLTYDSLSDFSNFAENVHLSGNLHSTYVNLDDVSALVPAFRNMESVVTLDTSIDGLLSNLNVRGINVQYGESFVLSGNLSLSGLPDLEQTFVFGDLKELRFNADDTEKFIADLMQEPFTLPQEVRQLGVIRYRGNIAGFLSNLVIFGNLQTDIGSVSTDILVQFANNFQDIHYEGTLRSDGLNLGKLLMSENFGNIAFYFNTTGSQKANAPLQGTIDASVSEFWLYNYNYQDIRFSGVYDGTGFTGNLVLKDENINLVFNGLIDLTQQLPIFDFELNVRDANLYALNLTERYTESLLSFDGRTNMTGNSLDNINGFFHFDDIVFTSGERMLNLGQIHFLSRTERDYTNFSIRSRYLNGYISGNFKYSQLAAVSTQALQKYIPSLDLRTTRTPLTSEVNLDLTISNTDELSYILDLPYKLGEAVRINGQINRMENIVTVLVSAPTLTWGKTQFRNTDLFLWGEDDVLEFRAETSIPTNGDFWNLALNATAQSDTLSANFEWDNRLQMNTVGEFRTSTTFLRDSKNGIISNVEILPSEIFIADSLWRVKASAVRLEKDSIRIDDFRLGNEHQYLVLDGILSKNRHDSLRVELQNIDLAFISMLTNMDGFSFGGFATGKSLIFSTLEQPVFDATLAVEEVKLNNTRIGDAAIFATWDSMNEKIHAIVSIQDGNEIIALAHCTYKVSNNFLDIFLDANRVSLDFLSQYYRDVLPNTTGFVSGQMRIGGTLDEVRFDGRMKVSDGQVTVGLLGATYTFNDSVIMTPNSIEFPNLTLFDERGNRVRMNGSLTHDGTFSDFRYELDIQTANAQVVNLEPGENDLFFGEAFANANVRITGNEDVVDIRVVAATRPGTRLFIKTNESNEATDAGFIRFVNHNMYEIPLQTARNNGRNQDTGTTVRLSLQIEATPAAEIGLIIDPIGGDMISARGSGNIRIEYNSNQAEARMHGSYTIESGSYAFSLQDGLFRKNFRIEEGSSVFWTGSPTDAQVNIRAIYALTASLRDLLDENLLSAVQGTRFTVPVHCVLILTGDLMSPSIAFDIVLPASDEGIRQVVRSVINTEEMMTTQILHLLLFNKFFMPNQQNMMGGFSGNEFASFLTATVSSQLNNLISQVSTNNALSLGFDMRRINEMDMEYQIDLLFRPNDRWIFSGNFGYRESSFQNIDNFNPYITDIDIEYLLTESGQLRLRFYNHTIDRMMQLRDARSTQGLGVVYRESFNTVGDMFRHYWRLITGQRNRNREENEESEST